MKTKCVGMVAGLLVLCAMALADDKGKEPAAAPVDASDYKPFAVPLPGDKSGFTFKPPDSGALPMSVFGRSLNPRLWRPPSPTTSSRLVPRVNGVNLWTNARRSTFVEKAIQHMPKWQFRDVPFSRLLTFVEDAYGVKLVVCSPPQRLQQQEDVKISITLKRETMEESLDSLMALGLVWRRLDETYYIAWNDQDLPIPRAAITPFFN